METKLIKAVGEIFLNAPHMKVFVPNVAQNGFYYKVYWVTSSGIVCFDSASTYLFPLKVLKSLIKDDTYFRTTGSAVLNSWKSADLYENRVIEKLLTKAYA